MRDAEPRREDLESTRFPTGDPTPPSDPLQLPPWLINSISLLVRNGAYLSMPAGRNLSSTEGKAIVTPERFGWIG